MRVIDPEVLGSWEEFIREWCSYGGNNKWVVKDPDALGSYLVETGASLRRLREGRPLNKLIINVDYDDGAEVATEDLARSIAMKVLDAKIGRVSWRERVCKCVKVSVDAVELKKKEKNN